MGSSQGAICTNCGKEYTIRDGGGFLYHLLHCEQCGSEKTILLEEIGETHLQFLKGLKIPYSIPTAQSDKHIQETFEGEPITMEEYYRRIEAMLEKCDCGGNFSFAAPPRCPNCRSTSYKDGPLSTFYDYD